MDNSSEYAIGWGTLALINAGIAQAKDRSGLAWFLGSLVLGPLATLLIVAHNLHHQVGTIPKNKPPPQNP